MYEHMKYTVIMFSYCLIMLMDAWFIIHYTKTFVKWIVKKIRQHKEKKLAMAQTGEEE